MKRPSRQVCLLLGLLVWVALGSGCATPDSDGLSERPWNAPKSWEHGIPQSMMEGR